MAISRMGVVLCVLVVIAGCASLQQPSTIRGSEQQLRLTAADGSTLTLEELQRGHEATVLVFWSTGCPCVRRYQARVDALLDRYPADRVRIVGISSNAGESFCDVLRVAQERGVRIPIFRDEGGRLAEAVGARSTPTIVVLDSHSDIRYYGWLDNEHLPGDSSRQPWLDSALEAILAGKSDYVARRPVFGCPITRDLFGPKKSAQCPYCANSQTP